MRLLFPILLLVAALAPAADAQILEPVNFLHNVDMVLPTEPVEVPLLEPTTVEITLRDLSQDSPQGLVGAGEEVRVFQHSTTFEVEAVSRDSYGWHVYPVPGVLTFGGEEKTTRLTVTVLATADNPQFVINITARTKTDGGTIETHGKIRFFSPGIPGYLVRTGGSFDIGPREVVPGSVIVKNVALVHQTFQADVVDNPCDLDVGILSRFSMSEGDERRVHVTLQGPEDRIWFNNVDCSIRVAVNSVNNPAIAPKTASIGLTVNGWYVAPEWVFWTVAIILATLIVFLVAKRRKERLEEELLGKPQKPWTIPVEEVYLQHLKRKDERAWYVVRHYLMEDEYKSALLWYKNYKTATRAGRTKERVVLAHERAYKKWKARWQKRVEAPESQVERLEAKLQKRLDREARATYRKDKRKQRSLVRKMRKAHEKQVARAQEKWQKQARRAEKKGRPAPVEPVIAEPDYPEEPRLERALLADHKWARKVERARRKAVRKRGDLEVRFEKADARHLEKVRRKVRRVARKIDDPEFVRQHPLLSDGG